MKPQFEPMLEEALGDLFLENSGEQLKLFPDPEDPKPMSTAKALLKAVEAAGSMRRTDMQKFTFDRRKNKKTNHTMARGWWNTNLTAMIQAKLFVKAEDGIKWKVNPTIDIDKLKIVMPKYQNSWKSSVGMGGNERAKWRANIKGAQK